MFPPKPLLALAVAALMVTAGCVSGDPEMTTAPDPPKGEAPEAPEERSDGEGEQEPEPAPVEHGDVVLEAEAFITARGHTWPSWSMTMMEGCSSHVLDLPEGATNVKVALGFAPVTDVGEGVGVLDLLVGTPDDPSMFAAEAEDGVATVAIPDGSVGEWWVHAVPKGVAVEKEYSVTVAFTGPPAQDLVPHFIADFKGPC